MILVDSHCHLDYPELQKDFPGVLARARSAGVETMLRALLGMRSEAP